MASATVTFASSIISSTIWFASRICAAAWMSWKDARMKVDVGLCMEWTTAYVDCQEHDLSHLVRSMYLRSTTTEDVSCAHAFKWIPK